MKKIYQCLVLFFQWNVCWYSMMKYEWIMASLCLSPPFPLYMETVGISWPYSSPKVSTKSHWLAIDEVQKCALTLECSLELLSFAVVVLRAMAFSVGTHYISQLCVLCCKMFVYKYVYLTQHYNNFLRGWRPRGKKHLWMKNKKDETVLRVEVAVHRLQIV